MRIISASSRTVRWPIGSGGAARGTWSERAAVVIVVTDELGNTGMGEAAPLPGMSIDAIADAVSAAAELAGRVPLLIESPADATGVADRITIAPAARFAIESALLSALAQRTPTRVAALWNAIP